LERVRPLFTGNQAQIARLIGLLDDARFETREQAERELANLRDLAEPALGRALAKRPSPELRRRLARIAHRPLVERASRPI
jgi:hypothetical protein